MTTLSPKERESLRVTADPAGEACLLNPTEVARRLRIGKTSLYGWLARGHLAHHRVGRIIRIREADVEAFLARNRVESATPHAYERGPQV